ncbi:amino acid adenylation domain-containing protein [Kitasatospora sp. LaBMicrA B282]|uniref:amino acid adenylation domain-containing protein n=1 Tax=Kitasatospora sp. LaBMicrA B282 TaxID=3420949 RepID=UPI003D095AC8
MTGTLQTSTPQTGTLQTGTDAARAARMARLAAQRTRLAAANSASVVPVVARGAGVEHPVSFAQERLWFLDRLGTGGSSYNVPWALRLTGELDVNRLGEALNALVTRHEILRTRYTDTPDGCRQIIDEPGTPLPLPVIDVTDEHTMESAARSFLALPFDLQAAPPVRAQLLRLTAAEHLLLLSIHHIAFDGWSLGILADELRHLLTGRQLEPLTVQYLDYATWQRTRPDQNDDLTWWTTTLTGVEQLHLPLDHPRPAVQQHHGHTVDFHIDPTTAQLLRTHAQQHAATPFMALLTAFAVLLNRYSGQHDLCIGTPVANRDHTDLHHTLGLFVDTIALRLNLQHHPDYTTLLTHTRTTVLNALTHQNTPFERIVEELNPTRDLSHHPLFQVLFNMTSAGRSDWEAGGLTATTVDLNHGQSKYDLAVTVADTEDGGYTGTWQYDTSLFDPATAHAMARHFTQLVRTLVDQPTTPVAELPLLTPAELAELAAAWQGSPAEDERESEAVPVHELILRQAMLAPDAPALAQGERVVSYRELADRSAAIAARLPAGQLIGLCTDRGPEMITALLATLRAGSAYVPLDPELPATRLRHMIQDAGITTILTDAGTPPTNLHQAIGDLPIHLLDLADTDTTADTDTDAAAPAPSPQTTPDDLCYVIYTSGSTGLPKGVAVHHRNLAHYATAMLAVLRHETAGEATGEAVDHEAPLHFATVSTLAADLGNTSIFPALISGGCVHVLDYDTATSPHRFAAYLRNHPIDVLKIVPSHFEVLYRGCADPAQAVPRRALVFGGEALPVRLVDDIAAQAPECRVINHYGPTETCVGSLVLPVHTLPRDRFPHLHTVPIGRPLGSTTVAVLDGAGQPVPFGVPGVLHIGGPGVARGYLNRPELTAERFVEWPDPTGVPTRYFRTGDLVRTLPGGWLDFLGRDDHQVKIRGHRVELGEVEAAVANGPGVRQAVVRPVRSGGEAVTALAAYVVAEPDFEPGALLALLRTALPDHMVPATVTVVPEVPRTLNGKIDFSRLPEPTGTGMAPTDPAGTAPTTETESRLLDLWSAVLQRPVTDMAQNLFDAGGHSLLLMRFVARVKSDLGHDLSLRDCFARPTLRALAELLDRAGAPQSATAVPVVARGAGVEHPVSFAQERLWFLDRLGTGGSSYNVPWALRLTGDLDVNRLGEALNALVTRHEILRTRYTDTPDGCRQIIDEPGTPLPLPVIDVTDEHAMESTARSFLTLPFDLQAAPPVRAQLLRLTADEHLLLLSVHHIAFDGWSLGILAEELHHLLTGRQLEPLTVQYLDYAAWQRTRPDQNDDLTWWTTTLTGVEQLHLPLDHPRPAVQQHHGHTVDFHIDPTTAQLLRTHAQQHAATPFMALLTAFAVLLNRYSGQHDLCIGTPVANRDHTDLHHTLGLFVDTIALRLNLQHHPDYTTLLTHTRTTVLNALTHQNTPFERIVEELNPTRDLSHHPLFQVMFSMAIADTRETAWEVDGLTATSVDLDHGQSKYDLAVSVADAEDGGYTGTWQYDTSLFDPATAHTMARQFARLVRALVEQPDQAVSRASFLSPAELDELTTAWQGAPAEPAGATVHELILRQAALTPDAPALTQGERTVSYRELAEHSAALAARLPAGGRIGISTARSPEMIVALLATLRAGSAYVPLDPELPATRLRHMIQDAGITTVITDTPTPPPHLHQAIGDRPIHLLNLADTDTAADANAETAAATPASSPQTTPDDLCYVIYTSGSTGLPKGVAVHHAGVVNYVQWAARSYGLAPGTTALLHSPLAFDLTVTTALAPLVAGACVRLVATDGVEGLVAALRESTEPYQLVKLTPAHLRLLNTELADELARRPLADCLVVGGEALDHATAAPWLTWTRVVNEYGPTETVVGCTVFELGAAAGTTEPLGTEVPIGAPIANTTNHVLDEHLRPVPYGVVGELCVGGAGVTRGYLNQPALTAAKFVPDPFTPGGGRLYRTGDLVVRRRDGVLEYRGRNDGQVKIRGHRVELGEVEDTLRRLPGVADACAVRLRQDGFDGLVAYLVPHEGHQPQAGELRELLRAALPAPMVPDRYRLLARLPLTTNGKVDRRALPTDFAPVTPVDPAAAPAPVVGEVEQRIHQAWAQVLGRERIGRLENFFDVGGHSLLLVALHARLTEQFGPRLRLLDLFRHPTIAALARFVDAPPQENTPSQATGPATRPARTTDRAARSGALARIRARRQGA